MSKADYYRKLYERAMEPAWAAQNRALARAQEAYSLAVWQAAVNYYSATETPRLAYKAALVALADDETGYDVTTDPLYDHDTTTDN
jgi:hypothetical protein